MIYDLYEWQKNAYLGIKNEDAIISAPTGTGKTIVAYLWAGIMNIEGVLIEPNKKIIFTAPIKALSNERYMDLKRLGFNVGLETGDFKKNTNAKIICCTQEIYTMKYAKEPDMKVIIDEFHYIFTNPDRARAYIDGIRFTNLTSSILVMSATFANPDMIRLYLDRITGREFILHEETERVTELHYLSNPISCKNVKNALVFAFTVKTVNLVASYISKIRRKYKQNKQYYEYRKQWIDNMMDILNIKVSKRNYDIYDCLHDGVGIYYGAMLPKEKILVEKAFRNKIIDVVVGTDALSLGVNLPAETVVFAFVHKFMPYRILLDKNSFVQMAGRAGRKGLYEKGYVRYLSDIDAIFKTEGKYLYRGYNELLDKPLENANITLLPDVSSLLKDEKTIEEEASWISKYSLPQKNKKDCLNEINNILNNINTFINQFDNIIKVKELLADVWNSENTFEQNCNIAELLINTNGVCNATDIADIFIESEKSKLQGLLKALRYINNLDTLNIIINNKEEIKTIINEIDETVFGFEDIINKIDSIEVKEIPKEIIESVNKRKKKKSYYINRR